MNRTKMSDFTRTDKIQTVTASALGTNFLCDKVSHDVLKVCFVRHLNPFRNTA